MRNLVERLVKIVEEKAGGKHTVFAKNAGIPTSTFQGYINGRPPHAEHLIRIREKYNVNINWLLTGEGEMFLDTPTSSEPSCIDIEVITKVIKGVEEYLRKAKKELEPDIKARLVALLYERFAKTDEEPDQKTIVSYLKLVA